MKPKATHTSTLYEFLDKTGVLANGSDAEILAAKKQYWKEYKAAWKLKQRQETHEFRIVCQPHEAKIISDAATRHKRSLQAFIKEAVLANIRTTYVVPDVLAINTIQQQLAINYNVLQTLFDENIVPYQLGKTLLDNADQLERKVMAQLRSPKTLEQWVTETVTAHPDRKEALLVLLQKL